MLEKSEMDEVKGHWPFYEILSIPEISLKHASSASSFKQKP